MNVLNKYLPQDLVNMIYDYIYSSMYYDVVQELKMRFMQNRYCNYNLVNCSCWCNRYYNQIMSS